MHKNELVNILYAARADMERHRDRLTRLQSPAVRERTGVDTRDAADVERILGSIVRELDEAIAQRNIRR